jgi:glucokinase
MHVLVGDIGGTKTNLAIAQVDDEGVQLTEERRYSSGDFDSLEAIVRLYVGETGVSCRRAAFAVAGPVQQNRSKTTNLPWALDGQQLERALNLTAVRLLNDLEAVAWGIAALGPDDLEVLHPGEGLAGNACVVAAGTGLGEAGLYWDGARHHPFATEGGHTDFAPSDAREYALLEYLRERHGHVSWERVVSGMGIVSIYDFLVEWRAVEPEGLAGQSDDQAAAIALAASTGGSPVSSETMELFMRLYGREAGNMALKHMSLGGVYLGGGIAPKNLALLRQSNFLKAFFEKGRMEPLMRRMPVKVILEERAPLYGAAGFLAREG